MDPATFATELGILAVRGFGDMGKHARDLMVRKKIIAAQQGCELRPVSGWRFFGCSHAGDSRQLPSVGKPFGS